MLPSYEQIVFDPRAVPFFLDFLSTKGKDMQTMLLFVCECEQYQRLVGNQQEMQSFGTKIIKTYFEESAFKVGGDVEHEKILAKYNAGKKMTLDTFSNAQRYASNYLLKNHFEAFLASPAYEMMTQELPGEFRILSLLDVLRDAKKISALQDFLLIESPENVSSLRFCLELRNNYRPLLAAALAPVDDKSKSRKANHAKTLIECAKGIVKKYLHAIPKQSAMSAHHAEEVKRTLEDLERKVEFAASSTDATPQPLKSTPSASPDIAAVQLEELIRNLADVFHAVEESALQWLEGVAIARAQRSDVYVSTIMGGAAEASDLLEERTPPVSFYSLDPSAVERRRSEAFVSKQDHFSRALGGGELITQCLLGVRNLVNPASELVDETGNCVTGVAKDCRFATYLVRKLGPRDTSSTPIVEPPPSSEKATNLAHMLASEWVLMDRARQRMALGTSLNPATLANSELHAHAFPLVLCVELDTFPSNQSPLAPDALFLHHFVLPCRRSAHTPEGCTCLFGAAVTKMVQRRNERVVDSLALQKAEPLKRSRSGRMYCEYAISLTKMGDLGLGLKLALNRDGSVVVSRFISEAGTPSPAATSGRVAIDDDLLSINGVGVHARKFEDIIAQIRSTPGEVALRFSRGNFLEASSSGLGGGSNIAHHERGAKERDASYFVLAPECFCVLSPEPCFARMRQHVMRFDFETKEFPPLTAVPAVTECGLVSLLELISPATLLDTLACLLLERRVLLLSDQLDRVAPAFEALRSLLFPFHWPHDWAPLLPESHIDWFASRVRGERPFFCGYCAVDVHPVALEKYVPRRQGRLVLREEAWSAREKDALLPSERVLVPGAVRSGLQALVEKDTLLLDLDGDRLSRFRAGLGFPSEVREEMLLEINRVLRRGGRGSEFGVVKEEGGATGERENEDANGFLFKVVDSASLIGKAAGEEKAARAAMREERERVEIALREVVMSAYCKMFGRVNAEFVVSRRENVLGFFRKQFLRQSNPNYREFLEAFTTTECFQQHVKRGVLLEL